MQLRIIMELFFAISPFFQNLYQEILKSGRDLDVLNNLLASHVSSDNRHNLTDDDLESEWTLAFNLACSLIEKNEEKEALKW